MCAWQGARGLPSRHFPKPSLSGATVTVAEEGTSSSGELPHFAAGVAISVPQPPGPSFPFRCSLNPSLPIVACPERPGLPSRRLPDSVDDARCAWFALDFAGSTLLIRRILVTLSPVFIPHPQAESEMNMLPLQCCREAPPVQGSECPCALPLFSPPPSSSSPLFLSRGSGHQTLLIRHEGLDLWSRKQIKSSLLVF